MIAGVCDGIATSFAIDVLIVRVAVVALVLAGGVGLAAYAAAWLLVPLSPVAGAPSASPAPPPPVRVFDLVDELPLVSARR
jgi:phage shock protein PspC (stress-responsive transcriptional regulator)